MAFIYSINSCLIMTYLICLITDYKLQRKPHNLAQAFVFCRYLECNRMADMDPIYHQIKKRAQHKLDVCVCVCVKVFVCGCGCVWERENGWPS